MMPKYIPIIVVILLLFVAAAGGYFFWWPKYQEFSLKKQELETKDEEIKKKEEYLAGLENILERLKSFEDEISKIETALPIHPSPAALFNFLHKASLENGLILEDTNIGQLYNQLYGLKKTESGEIQRMSFSASLTGSYSSFKNFLSALYRNSRLIEIKSISFSQSAQEKKDLFSFKLELQTYSYAR